MKLTKDSNVVSNIKCDCCKKSKVLFFPDERQVCYNYVYVITSPPGQKSRQCPKKECRSGERECPNVYTPKSKCRIVQLYNALGREASKSIELCIFSITHWGLAKLLINVSKKGVVVRVVTDAKKRQESGSKIHELVSEGIEVRERLHEGDALMHLKFCIIDKNRLIHGSLNYTHAIERSDECLVFNSQENIVKYFVRHFDDLWKKSSKVTNSNPNQTQPNQTKPNTVVEMVK